MKTYSDIVKSISSDGTNVIKCFIDNKNKLLVFMVNSSTKGVCYILYDIYTHEIISWNSNRYNQVVSGMPRPVPYLHITQVIDIMEVGYIESFIKTRRCDVAYLEILRNEKQYAIDDDALAVLDYFIDEDKEKKKEKSYDVNNTNEDYTSAEFVSSTSNISESEKTVSVPVANRISNIPKFEPGIKPPKKENKMIIVVFSVIASILGLATAVLIAGPWDLL